ncbi:hybrid sensor histidine kinase/response regulator transcription factor [Leifsonia sp. Root112D2]|uniref:hybrid sensor histidine kinase/response regulator transcription factor n=1 Tax=Leifsonia sp. Root112D2 TaxID=1736426 RepID=UPI0006F6498D|nr:GAF domain-containing protein [Leifsonia sp. Root112D2]KQV07969.1 hypothetical protein ASC63_12450 [Leifsonia sp. Root112D2]
MRPHTTADPERLRAQLRTLSAMATDLAGQFSLQPLLERILRHTMELLNCDSGSICTVDEAAGVYRKEVDLGVGCLEGQTFPLSEGVTGEVVRVRGPVIFDEYAEVSGGHIPEDEREALHGVIGVPIRWNGIVIGSCVIFSRDPQRRFTQEDAALLELFATHAAIAITNARLHALATDRASEAAIMAERERAVRDVHDTVGRGLAAVLLHLDAAERDHAEARDPSAELSRARIAAGSALTETRRTVLGLGPALLDGHSLGEAMALELAWVESTTTVTSRLVVIGETRALPPETVRQLFRIVQESLTNVIEHARASHVRVGLVYGGDAVTVLIEDDGRGFDVATMNEAIANPADRPLGLQGLLARAAHLGGFVTVDSTVGWGTRVRAEFPVAGAAVMGAAHPRWQVLVVHESPMVRAGLVRMLGLAEPDIQVVGELGESSQVIDAFELLRPHVVLVHLAMPHVDGVRLTSYLRALDSGAAVVMLADSANDERIRDAAAGGAVGFVTADVDAPGLARVLVAAARGDAPMAAELFGSLALVSMSALDEEGLTAREQEVRTHLERGLADKQIAGLLNISVKTVEKHVGAILRKTGAANRTVLAVRAALRR